MTIHRVFLSSAMLIAMVIGVFATAQEPDYFRIGDLEYELYSNPLEQILNRSPSDGLRFWIAPLTGSSGNSRGYLATWEISDEKLYLLEIDSWFCGPGFDDHPKGCRRVTLIDILGQNAGEGRQFAGWYTGQLRIPEGRQLLYVHSGYHSVYERDLIFNVKAGKITARETVDNTNRPLPMEQGWVQPNIFAKPRKIGEPRPKRF